MYHEHDNKSKNDQIVQTAVGTSLPAPCSFEILDRRDMAREALSVADDYAYFNKKVIITKNLQRDLAKSPNASRVAELRRSRRYYHQDPSNFIRVFTMENPQLLGDLASSSLWNAAYPSSASPPFD